MGHGTPDWWGAEPGQTTFQVQDVGELAARLGSIDTFDRRGNVIFLEDFESGFTPRWLRESQYTGVPVLSGAGARSGAYSLKLETTPVSGAACGILCYRPLPVMGKIGLEASFAIGGHVGIIAVGMGLYDGTNFAIFSVRYLPPTDKWQYLDSAGAWVDLFTSMVLYESPTIFHTLKIVADYENGEYFYIIVNEREQGLSGIAGRTGEQVAIPSLVIYSTVINDDTNIGTAYLDDVIVTQNEP